MKPQHLSKASHVARATFHVCGPPDQARTHPQPSPAYNPPSFFPPVHTTEGLWFLLHDALQSFLLLKQNTAKVLMFKTPISTARSCSAQEGCPQLLTSLLAVLTTLRADLARLATLCPTCFCPAFFSRGFMRSVKAGNTSSDP